jgi:prepilin-type N-terminal cleavage/methylation domain-containing protein
MPLLFFCLLSFFLEPYKMRLQTKSSQGGFSLFELLIVLVIIGIVTTFALVQLGSSKVDLQRQQISREFKIYLERARFDSVKRRAENPNRAAVTLNSATSFTVQLDFNEDGILQSNEIRVVDFTQRSNTRILVTDAFNYPVRVTFDRRGHVTTVDALGNNVDPVFTICSNCSAGSPDQSVISLSTTGTVAVTRNEVPPSSLPTPVISNANVTPNCYIYIAGANANVNTVCPLQ